MTTTTMSASVERVTNTSYHVCHSLRQSVSSLSLRQNSNHVYVLQIAAGILLIAFMLLSYLVVLYGADLHLIH